MSNTLPRDPVALMAARSVVLLMVLLVVLALLPRQDAPLAPVVRAAAPIVIVTPAPPSDPAPPEPQPAPIAAPAAIESAPTVAPVAVVPAAEPSSQIVHNADGSTSLPGSETWLDEQPAVTSVDPALQIARDAAAAYQSLPVAAPPSAENEQPVTVRRPHTGR